MGASPAVSGGFFPFRNQVGRRGSSMPLFLALALSACSSSPISTLEIPCKKFQAPFKMKSTLDTTSSLGFLPEAAGLCHL